MTPTDAYIVAGFLTREVDRFAAYLDDCAIDPSEAGVIIEEIKLASDGRSAPCVEQFSGFIGE